MWQSLHNIYVHQIIKLYTLNLFYISYISIKVQIIFFKNSIINSCQFNSVFSSGSNGKESACSVGDPGLIPGQEDPLEKGMTTHSSILTWRIPWTENPGGLQSMKSQSQMWLSELHIHFLILIIWLQHHLMKQIGNCLCVCEGFFKGI